MTEICLFSLWDVTLFSSLSPADPSQFVTNPTTSRNPASGASRMVAIFDYDPRESSPNTDIEVRLYYCVYHLCIIAE